ncbi:MAG: hypothetical protein ACO2ZM_04125 [Francisellaceae bacterium]
MLRRFSAQRLIVILSILLIALGGFQLAEAKRFGGGSSHGYNRSAPTNTYNKSNASTPAKKNNFGIGKILAALGIGALLAWLFSAQGMSGLLIVLLIAAALIFFIRRFKATQATAQQNQNHSASFTQSNPSWDQNVNALYGSNSDTISETVIEPAVKNGQLADGTPEAVFNHQALNLFNQLQSLNTKSGLEKIRSYLTEDLYHSIKADVENNSDIAEFRDVRGKPVACEKHGNQWLATVMFVGCVKEDSGSDWQNFEEIWHFSRADGEHLWQVAGVQQI